MHTRTGFGDGPCSVQSRSFQVRVATALFLQPKNTAAWELVKHRMIGMSLGRSRRRCLLWLRSREEKYNQLAASGRLPLGLDLGVRQDTSRPGSAGHDGPCKRILRLDWKKATEELNSGDSRKDAATAVETRFRHVSVASGIVTEWSPRRAGFVNLCG